MKTKRQTTREAKRLFHLCLVNGLLDEGRTRKVVEWIIDAKRRDGLALLTKFQRLLRLDYTRHTAEVESSVPLPGELRARILAGLAHAYGPGISASFVHNPGLIGGIRIKIGSDVYDGSVRARLDMLEKSF